LPDTPNISLEALVGTQIRALRTALGMTLSDLAAAAGLSPGMLSKVETGQTSPPRWRRCRRWRGR
jgi:transcriptional regulator with XRE-family HTH domain